MIEPNYTYNDLLASFKDNSIRIQGTSYVVLESIREHLTKLDGTFIKPKFLFGVILLNRKPFKNVAMACDKTLGSSQVKGIDLDFIIRVLSCVGGIHEVKSWTKWVEAGICIYMTIINQIEQSKP